MAATNSPGSGADSSEKSTAAATHQQHATAAQRVRHALLTAFMPFFYGAATRVPIIFICVYAYQVLALPWWEIGLMIGTYQAARAVANILIPLIGPVAYHPIGVLLGLVGYLLIVIDDEDPKAYFWGAVSIIGFSEVITSIQSYTKHEYDEFGGVCVRQKLRLQYAFNVAGTAVGFGVGGALYQFAGGIHGPAYFGISLEATELLSLGFYFYMVAFMPSSAPTIESIGPKLASQSKKSLGGALTTSTTDNRLETMEEDGDDQENENQESSQGREALRRRRLTNTSLSLRQFSMLNNHEDGFNQFSGGLSFNVASATQGDLSFIMPPLVPDAGNKPSWVSYLLAATFAFQALLIGVVLSTAPLLLFVYYKYELDKVGYIFAVGEIAGACILFSLVPVKHQQIARKYLPGPFNVIFILGSMGLLAILLVIHSEIFALVAFIIIMALNDLGTSLTAECIGGTVHESNYKFVNALSNVSRRIGNFGTAVLGPIMFGKIYYLPFAVFGSLMVVWSMVLAVAFEVRGRQLAKKKNKVTAGLKFYLKESTFITSEREALAV